MIVQFFDHEGALLARTEYPAPRARVPIVGEHLSYLGVRRRVSLVLWQGVDLDAVDVRLGPPLVNGRWVPPPEKTDG